MFVESGKPPAGTVTVRLLSGRAEVSGMKRPRSAIRYRQANAKRRALFFGFWPTRWILIRRLLRQARQALPDADARQFGTSLEVAGNAAVRDIAAPPPSGPKRGTADPVADARFDLMAGGGRVEP